MFESSVEEADKVLQTLRDFNPRTAAGHWEKERLFPVVESQDVRAHQLQKIADGQREVRELNRLVF